MLRLNIALWPRASATLFYTVTYVYSYLIHRTRLFENLRMLPHAPGVQMANIPEDGVPLKEESEALDEANPDKRLPQQIKDKIVEADNEFEDSTKSGNKNESDANAANTTCK